MENVKVGKVVQQQRRHFPKHSTAVLLPMTGTRLTASASPCLCQMSKIGFCMGLHPNLFQFHSISLNVRHLNAQHNRLHASQP